MTTIATFQGHVVEVAAHNSVQGCRFAKVTISYEHANVFGHLTAEVEMHVAQTLALGQPLTVTLATEKA